jgi:hypothetical protein
MNFLVFRSSFVYGRASASDPPVTRIRQTRHENTQFFQIYFMYTASGCKWPKRLIFAQKMFGYLNIIQHFNKR